MSVRTDTVNLIVNVNGDSAQNNLNNLRKKAADISFEMKGLVKGTAEYIAKGKELNDVTTQMDTLKKTIGLTALSEKELIAELNKLKALKGSISPLSQEHKELAADIHKVSTRLSEVRNGTQGFSSMLGKLSDSAKQFGAIAAASLGFQFIITQFQNVVKGAAKVSDQLADLRRVAGLTANEASNLNKKLGEIDTRTSAEGLRNIAIIAGKLGVAKDEVFGFTKAVDQLVVTLGDELGNADQITTSLGKILNVFDGKVTGDNISKLGNAFVELANTGAATGGFIADFDQRLSGIAKTAGIGLGELSGLGAGLEELGGKVESTSSAVQKLVISVSKDLAGSAKIAGMSTKEFSELFKKDATEALIRYSEGLVKNKKSFSEFTSGLADAGEEGVHTIATLSLLANNADYLRGRMNLGKEAIERTTASTEAFRLKNETFGASIEKLGKAFTKLVEDSKLTDFVKGIVQGFTTLISSSKSLTDQWRDQQAAVKKLQTETLPLIDRYEELKKKTTLNKEEQVELNKSITAIGNTIPGAITQFDAYGRALGINANKAREFINLQQAILKEKNREAINDEKSKLPSIEKELKMRQLQLAQGQRGVDKLTRTLSILQNDDKNYVPSPGFQTELNYYNKAISVTASRIGELQARMQGVKGIIDELDGSNRKLPDADKPGATVTTDITLPKPPADNKAAAAAAKQKANEYNRIKEEYEKFQKELLNLKQRAEIKGEEPEQAEIDTVTAKYNALIEKAKEHYFKLAAQDKNAAADSAAIEEAKQQELRNILIKYQNKKFAKIDNNEYDQALIFTTEYSEKLKEKAAQDYVEGTISKGQYELKLTQIERDEISARVSIAKDYAATVEKAAKDVTAFIKIEGQKTTEDLRKETEARKELAAAESAAAFNNKVLSTRPGSSLNLKYRKEQIEEERRLELQAAKDTWAQKKIFLEEGNAILEEINTEYNQRIKDADAEGIKGKIDAILQYVQIFKDALTSLNTFINNAENRQFNKEKANNEKKKKGYKDQLDNKLISKTQYDKKVQAADEEIDKKSKELKLKQAKREKALSLFQAIINTAAGIAKAIPSIPLMAIAAIVGALQIAAIANAPLPELGKGDWIREGDKHSDASGGINAKIERDEAVMMARAMNSNKVYTVTGTTAQITSALNSKEGGASWSAGAVVQMPKWRSEPPRTINANMPRIMEQGGIMRPLNQTPISAGNSDELIALSKLHAIMEQVLEATKDKSEKLHAVVSIKEYRQTEKLYEQAKKVSGLQS